MSNELGCRGYVQKGRQDLGGMIEPVSIVNNVKQA